MSDKPIPFSGPMVQAILAGRKSQTRRVVKPQPSAGVRTSPFSPSGIEDGHGRTIKPRVFPGDTLWVRETWGYRGGVWHCGEEKERLAEVWIHYKADGVQRTIKMPFDAPMPEQQCRCKPGDDHGEELARWWASWRPSMFMPRWASRITLAVTDVRVQRLLEISEEDAMAEGIELWRNYMHPKEPSPYWNSPLDSYHSLWDSINGEGSWDANPWVWAYTFTVAEAPDAR